MSTEAFLKAFDGMTADEIIQRLESKYEADSDALEEIERTKQNIAYIRTQTDYKGQTPRQCAIALAGNLLYWN